MPDNFVTLILRLLLSICIIQKTLLGVLKLNWFHLELKKLYFHSTLKKPTLKQVLALKRTKINTHVCLVVFLDS